MSYASLDLLVERHGERLLVQLTDRADAPTGVIVEEIVDRALADTDAVIDGYLAGRYAMPIVEVPRQLVDLALSIATYKLHTFEAPKKIEQDYRDALATLKLIAEGKFRLPGVAGVEPESSGSEGVMTTDRPRDLTPENMRGLI